MLVLHLSFILTDWALSHAWGWASSFLSENLWRCLFLMRLYISHLALMSLRLHILWTSAPCEPVWSVLQMGSPTLISMVCYHFNVAILATAWAAAILSMKIRSHGYLLLLDFDRALHIQVICCVVIATIGDCYLAMRVLLFDLLRALITATLSFERR